ncbi:hypothetical protein [Streptomyces sp. Amel2xB2]|uniref:HD domain-containing protein n=1 Tax=Streptomyces sp. Amel2xB2 TaxID=1305829 RepID=UPI000DBA07FD|nr:hypothetical protein [Streptomyces sp. Amel2xB2]
MATNDASGTTGDGSASAPETAAPAPGSGTGPAPDPALRDRLLSRWSALLVSARDGAREPDPAPYGQKLLERWSEPQRRYHTAGHLLDVLDRVDELAPHTPEADLPTVLLAVWFHDAVYRPDRSENEERSAALAERALPEAGVGRSRTDEVARLVRLTVTHDPDEGDADGELLCDADLAVLAGSPAEYARYAAAVREEYGFVPDGPFTEGRAAVLRQLLGMPRLFRTPYGRRHWEHVARRNLETEMELLVKGGRERQSGT